MTLVFGDDSKRLLGELSNLFYDPSFFYLFTVLPASGDLSLFIALEAAVGAK